MRPDGRGIVRIQPIYLGLHHYSEVYGSVCSADVKGTPPMPKVPPERLRESASQMVSEFTSEVDLDFVEVKDPIVVSRHSELRTIKKRIDLDTDAMLVRSLGAVPLEMETLSKLGLPVARPQESFLRGLRAKKFLSESKFLYIGEIPSFSAPKGPYDFRLIQDRLGTRFRHIETNEFYRVFDRIEDRDVSAELDRWRKDFERVIEPDRAELENAARTYLALRRLCEREDANGVTINCGRFTEERPIVPCMAFNRLIDEGTMCACEGDITAMLSSLLLHAVSERAVTMGNFRISEEQGDVFIEHDLMPLSLASSKYTVRDYHGRKFGVTAYAEMAPGTPVTLLNMEESLSRLFVAQGKVKGTEDGIHCREIVYIELEGDLGRIRESLVGSQHMSMTSGHWIDAVQDAAKLLDMEVRSI